MAIVTNLELNMLRRDVKILRVHEREMRRALEAIATSRRGGMNKRLAGACLEFLKHCTPSADFERIRKEDTGSSKLFIDKTDEWEAERDAERQAHLPPWADPNCGSCGGSGYTSLGGCYVWQKRAAERERLIARSGGPK